MPQAKFVRTLFRRPTLLSAGVGTVNKSDPLDRLGVPHPSQWNVFFDDFDGQTSALTAASNGWAQQILVGTGTIAPISDTAATGATGAGGTMQLKTTGGATDSTVMTRHATLGQNFVWDSTRKFYAEVRLSVDSATLGELAFGLVPASTTTLAASMTEGFRIAKTSAVGTFDFKTFTGSATAKSTTSTLFNSVLMPLSTQITMGFAYNGITYPAGSFGPISGNATPFTATQFEMVAYIDINDGNGYRQQAIVNPLTSMPSQVLGLMPCVSYLNTSAVARTVNIDYVLVAQERFNA